MQAIMTAGITCIDPWYRKVYAWFKGEWPGGLTYGTPKAHQVSLNAYIQADAMMAQREPWPSAFTNLPVESQSR